MLENRILRALAPGELAQLRPWLVPIELRQREVLYAMGAPMEHVYFPQSGLVSLLNINEAGEAIEAGIVSAEGVVGGVTFLEVERSISQVVVQISGRTLKLPTPTFLEACQAIPRLKRLVNRHIQILLFQAQQNVACHAFHTVEGRLCRRMLQAQDVTHSNVLALTQESLSHMLGAQRTSISTIASSLQNAGFIRYRRGRIEILDKLGLEAAACECYSLIKQEIDARLPQPVAKQHDRGSVRQPGQVLSAKSP